MLCGSRADIAVKCRLAIPAPCGVGVPIAAGAYHGAFIPGALEIRNIGQIYELPFHVIQFSCPSLVEFSNFLIGRFVLTGLSLV